MTTKFKIGLFPFGGKENPYTKMIADTVAQGGNSPLPLQDTKFFPIRRACQSGVDLIHMFWPSNFYHSSTWFGTMIKRVMFADGLNCLSRLPLIYSADNLYPHDAESPDFEKSQIQKIVNKADGIIVASEAAQEIFSKAYRIPETTKFFIVPHCNYIGKYKDTISRDQARLKLGIAPQEKVMLSLGRINKYKGLGLLSKAFFAANAENSHLLIAGFCNQPELVEEINNNNKPESRRAKMTIHARFIPDDEIQVYMRAADCVVLSYDDVPMNPGSVILAMSFGLPVCCVNTGSVAEILGPRCLFSYQPHNLDSMITAIHTALECTDLAERGREAYDLAVKNHSPALVTSRLQQAYAQIIK
jgi:glycosyltransferase involved in cell wall biosynthesis